MTPQSLQVDDDLIGAGGVVGNLTLLEGGALAVGAVQQPHACDIARRLLEWPHTKRQHMDTTSLSGQITSSLLSGLSVAWHSQQTLLKNTQWMFEQKP